MSSQSDFIKVEKHVISVIKRHYGAEFDADTIADYVDDLRRFDEKILREGMKKVLSESKRRPTLAHVIDACKFHQKRPDNGISPQSGMPWHRRAEEMEKLVNDYLTKFKFSSTWLEAARDGYNLDLWRFLHAVASVQAQMILPGGNGIGWNGTDIFGAGTTITEEARKGFLIAQRRQADTGSIDVAVPTDLIRRWKTQVENRANQLTRKEVVMKKESIAPQKLEEEINRQLIEKNIPQPKKIMPTIPY